MEKYNKKSAGNFNQGGSFTKCNKRPSSSLITSKKAKRTKKQFNKKSLIVDYASTSSDSEMEITKNFKTQTNVNSLKYPSRTTKKYNLPEEFFDEDIDPSLQCKTKMVNLDKEYELFKQDMKIADQQNEDIEEEEQDRKNIDRTIYEVDEQQENYKKFLNLVDKKDKMIKSQHEIEEMEIDVDQSSDSGSSSDEENDWRNRKLYS